MNLATYLLSVGEADAVALIEARKTTSYRQLRENAGCIAAGLQAIGLRPGDRAVLIADNSAFWVEAYLGIVAAGLTCVPLPPRTEPSQFQAICKSASPSVVVIQAKIHARLQQAIPAGLRLLTDLPVDGISAAAAASLPQADLQPVDVDEITHLAALSFTSGSTGAPRGVMVTHRNIIANTQSILGYLPLRTDDRMLQILPMHYCYGTSLVHTHLRAGATIVIENGFLFPDRVLDRMLQTQCTGFAGVPASYQILLRNSRFGRLPIPSLRYMLQAGGKLAEEFVDEVCAAQRHAKLYVMYGQTEATARLSYLPPELLDARRGSIGRGIPGVRLQVINEEGQPAATGETGQIVAEGENISPGYWQAPEESAEVFRDGKLYTGDLARMDEQGFIYVVGRSRDFLKLGGTRVACQHLERVLLRFSGTVDVAAVGVPDVSLGEAATYFIVHPKGALARDELLRFCKENLPPAHWPRQVHFVADLPRTASGKTDRPRLKQMAEAASA